MIVFSLTRLAFGIAILVPELLAQAPRRDLLARPPIRRALLVGNYEYRSVETLLNPHNDVRDLEKVLKKAGFETQVLENVTGPVLDAAVTKFATGLNSADVALFFYAGHGIEIDGANFMIPVDFTLKGEQEVRSSGYRLDRVQEMLQHSGARLTILVLDACRNNPFHGTRSLEGGLASMQGALGMLIAFAAGPGKTAAESGTNGRNGLFTEKLIEALSEPVELISAFRKTRQMVYDSSKGRQVPWLQENVLGQFYLNGAEQGGSPTPGRQAANPAALDGDAAIEEGRRLMGKQQFADALRAFDRAQRIDPENAYAYQGAGEAASSLALYSMAIDYYKKAIARKPDFAAAYFRRGLAYLSFQEYRLAIQDFSWAIDQEPDDPIPYERRARAYFGRREYALATEDYTRCIRLSPREAKAFQGRANVYLRQSRYREAIEDLREALRLKPDYADARQDLAEARRRAGGL